MDAIGGTPIIKLNKVATEVKSEIYVKLEFMNPGGSSKDRIGGFIMDRAVAAGKLKPGEQLSKEHLVTLVLDLRCGLQLMDTNVFLLWPTSNQLKK